MIEPEMAFCDLKGNMDLAEGLLSIWSHTRASIAPTRWNFSASSWTKSCLRDLISS